MPLDAREFVIPQETETQAQAQVRRLRFLADWLEASPELDLRMGAWKCGTARCAAGWATTIPYFQTEGLGANDVGTPTLRGDETFAVEAFFGAWEPFRPDKSPADVVPLLRSSADRLEAHHAL